MLHVFRVLLPYSLSHTRVRHSAPLFLNPNRYQRITMPRDYHIIQEMVRTYNPPPPPKTLLFLAFPSSSSASRSPVPAIIEGTHLCVFVAISGLVFLCAWCA